MKGSKVLTVLAFAFLLLPGFCWAYASQQTPAEWELHDLAYDGQGFLAKTGGDPYIVFPEIERQICSPSGINFMIRFESMPTKPSYMELFWRPTYEGFGEDRKVFFIMPPNKKDDSVDFTVPLEQQAGYKQIRLDIPNDLHGRFKIEKYDIVPLNALPAGTHLVDTYYKLSASAAGKPQIIIPYLIKTIRHGMARMAHDPSFLIVWLLMIIGLLAFHRILMRHSGPPSC